MKTAYGPTWLKREEIEKVQLQRLNLVLEREKQRGGFYSGLPEKLESLDELKKLPFTTEEDLRLHGEEMLVVSQSEVEKIITDSTSGTTGKSKRVFYTAGDCENTVELFADGISEMVYPRERVLVCMPYTGPDSLGNLISRAVEKIGAVPVEAGIGHTYEEIAELVRSERPESYIGFPQPLLGFLRLYGRMSFRRALLSGDACVPLVMEGIEKILNPGNPQPDERQISLFPHYGSREMGLAGAVTCSARKGMHLREGHVIAEIIDPKGNPLPDGEYGELVITTVGMEAQPLIRYRTGDRTRIIPGRCACGRETVRLDSVTRIGGSGNLMAEIDNEIFRDPEVIDCVAKVKDASAGEKCTLQKEWQISEAASYDKKEELLIEVLRKPDIKGGEKPFYPAKRHVLMPDSLSPY